MNKLTKEIVAAAVDFAGDYDPVLDDDTTAIIDAGAESITIQEWYEAFGSWRYDPEREVVLRREAAAKLIPILQAWLAETPATPGGVRFVLDDASVPAKHRITSRGGKLYIGASDTEIQVADRCPGREHSRHIASICEGSCCTACGGPIDGNEACRCGDGR